MLERNQQANSSNRESWLPSVDLPAALDLAVKEIPAGRDVAGRSPNFLVIGAGKSGTTSLWNQLRQHPQIFMHPSKHLNFFDEFNGQTAFAGPPPGYYGRVAKRNWESYRAEFSGATDHTAIGEACNAYLYSPSAAQRIRERVPDVRLIAILRHPADRALSRYLQLRRSKRETLEFGAAIRIEEARIEAGWWPDFHYVHGGFYYEQLTRYAALFPPEQMKIFLYEDMVADPLGLIRGIFAFLGIDEKFVPNAGIRYSPSGLPRNRGFDWALRQLRSARPLAERLLTESQLDYLLRIAGRAHSHNLVKPGMSPKDRAWMIDRYRSDTLNLQDFLKRDLSSWLV